MTAAMVAKSVDDYYEIVKEGFLDVKNPHQKKSWKSWNKQWVAVHASKETKDFGGNDVLLQFFASSPKQQRNDELYRIELRGTIALFRCDSKSHPCRAFGITKHGSRRGDGATVLVYLAGEDERHSETWMAVIRNALLPPSPLVQLEEVWQERHRVSLIDTMYSFQHGLLGAYGYMSFGEGELMVIHPHIGQVIAKWPLKTVLESKLLRVDYENATSGVFAIVLKSNKQSDLTRHVLAFYCPTARSAVESINAKLKDNEPKENGLNPPVRNTSYGKDLVELGSPTTDTIDELPNEDDECVQSVADCSDYSTKDVQPEYLSAVGKNQHDRSTVSSGDMDTTHEIDKCRGHRSESSPERSTRVNDSELFFSDQPAQEMDNNEKCLLENKRWNNSQPTFLSVRDQAPHGFISGISSTIFDYGTTLQPNSTTQEETSRTSSGSSDSSGSCRDSPLWPELWDEFFSKQEQRLAQLNIDSGGISERKYANIPSRVEPHSTTTEMKPDIPKEGLDVPGSTTVNGTETGSDHINSDTGEKCSVNSVIQGDNDQTSRNTKRVSIVSILSNDSHVYDDISSFGGYRRSDSIGGQTLYEELSDDEHDISAAFDAYNPQTSLPPPPPLPPPRPKFRRPSALKLMDLSDSIEMVLNNVEKKEKSSSAPGTPEKRRKASPTAWLNPVKSFKKILAKDKKKVDEVEGKPNCSHSGVSQKSVTVKVKRASSQPIFYYDRTELRKKPIQENLPDDFNDDDDDEVGETSPDGVEPSEPLPVVKLKNSDKDTEENASLMSESPDYCHWNFNSRQICLEHLLEKLKKGETADFCDCTYDSRERSRSTFRLPNLHQPGRRPSKSLSLDIERHLKILNVIAAGNQHSKQLLLTSSDGNSTPRFGRQESSEYCDMTPPTNRRSSVNNASASEFEDQNANDDYICMQNLSS